ncbi:MAG: PKD domain-containing protein [Bryobacterales bacterium]|nr:PKD domain-containing protein [Bryobacterales bacterium]
MLAVHAIIYPTLDEALNGGVQELDRLPAHFEPGSFSGQAVGEIVYRYADPQSGPERGTYSTELAFFRRNVFVTVSYYSAADPTPSDDAVILVPDSTLMAKTEAMAIQIDNVLKNAPGGPILDLFVTPATGMLGTNQTQQFAASGSGAASGVVWELALAPGAPANSATGSISTGGLYTAPATITSDYGVHVIAGSQLDRGLKEKAVVSLKAGEVISTPSVPAGPTDGVSGVLYGYSVTASSSSTGHPIEYTFDWGDGNLSGWTPPGVLTSFHAWNRPGVYQVKVQARCRDHTNVTSEFSAHRTVTIGGESISTPQAPAGPTSGVANTTYAFSVAGSASSVGHPIQYRFLWGNGAKSAFLPVGTTSASYAWPQAGLFQVTVEARCTTHTQVISLPSNHTTVQIAAPPGEVTDGKAAEVSVPESLPIPDPPSGPTAGFTGEAYRFGGLRYSSNLTHSSQILFDWGDGTDSGWVPLGHGNHRWSKPGTYKVRALLRCRKHPEVVSAYSEEAYIVITNPVGAK